MQKLKLSMLIFSWSQHFLTVHCQNNSRAVPTITVCMVKEAGDTASNYVGLENYLFNCN